MVSDSISSRIGSAGVVLALGCSSLSGCAPSQFALREREASRALAQAESVDARHLARYELTLSRLYLTKAREVAGQAHYALALSLAERSTESSLRARTLAIARAPGASAE